MLEKSMDFKNKNILVLGLGISGLGAVDLLNKLDANVFVHDDRNSKQVNGQSVNISSLAEMESKHFTAIIKSPGIPLENWYVKAAQDLKIPIMTELELAGRFCKSHLIAVTGTNGKTTVTSLIYEMIKKDNKCRVYKAGNIGIPFSEIVQKSGKDDYIVCESSSFQLEFTQQFHPEVAVINNVFPHHLEHHHTFDNYLAAKSKIFSNQTKNDYLIINENHSTLDPYIDKAESKVKYFGLNLNSSQAQVYLKNNFIYYRNDVICSKDDILIPGKHNIENFLAAATVAKILNVSNEAIKFAAKNFKGVEHRLEYLGKKKGLIFYNDSKATDEEATIVALNSIHSPIILLAGGMERGDLFENLPKNLKNVKLVELFGENKKVLQKAIAPTGVKMFLNDNLLQAFQDGVQKSKTGDAILLSPASASWDQFSSFEERGTMFKELYRELK
ncbi:UDP-N-acetylmuramoyl-L-alanine--D-glutamate ligase [Xylocopilactobacillus apis]|uniref:UDP-N-acetylmuramoylalanine--D-glutamate ligase n=1 Tax=Xylocopilactobacillus apis TaxID=2932183 RepID=A0AAU9CXU7_9LACO|nr:UDP-N-acetylmuramoyl-L-alanine--D-glutamate ligase [Xylocopilactobacillus apis]BDR56214.1 UDP-N-acetylmuramoylalanine--D-glutamate ligase [Xylocopilactobacillus apis]